MRADIPIFIASLTPKSVAQTARLADGWMPVLIPLGQLGQEVKAFRQQVSAANRDPGSVAVRSPGSVTVTQNAEAYRQEGKSHIAFYVTNMGDYYREQLTRLGHRDAVQTIRAAWDEGGRAAGIAAVPDDLVDSLFFAGSLEACIDRLEAQGEAGIDMHTVQVDAPPNEMTRILDRLVG